MQRIMGLDLGSRTIGVALSDPLGITAQGLKVIQRATLEADMQELSEIIRSYQVERIVLGFPKNMNNTVGPQGEASLAFADVLRERFGLEVILWDERLSTRAASNLLMESGRKRQQRKPIIDMVAATLILEGFLRSPAAQREAAQEGKE